MQMEKKRIIAANSTAVSAYFGAFRNLIRNRNRSPNKAAISKLSHSLGAGLIRVDDGESELKKSQRIREELMKAAIPTPHSH